MPVVAWHYNVLMCNAFVVSRKTQLAFINQFLVNTYEIVVNALFLRMKVDISCFTKCLS